MIVACRIIAVLQRSKKVRTGRTQIQRKVHLLKKCREEEALNT